MSPPTLILVLILLTVGGFYLGRRRAVAAVGGNVRKLHSLPAHYGSYVAIWCGLPALAIVAAWLALEPRIVEALVLSSLPPSLHPADPAQLNLIVNEIRNLAAGGLMAGEPSPEKLAAVEHYRSLHATGNAALAVMTIALAIGGIAYSQRFIGPEFRARNRVEAVIMVALIVCSTLAVLTTVGIILSLLFEAIRFFRIIPLHEFLFGLEWSPQAALRADQVGSSGLFGAVPLFAGTALISLIAMMVAVPVGLFTAIYMAEYVRPEIRKVLKPLLEILAGIPTVVYGFFAALTVAPLIRRWGEMGGLDISSESALAAGVVMGIMIIPFVSSLSDDVISTVPQAMRDGSYALGATKSETIKRVVIPAALPGIVAGIMLAVSRAIGETMIVVMAAGLAANLSANPFEAVTTVTVQIVTLLVGDQEFDSAKTLAAFALGLVLFCVTLALNIIALRVVNKYREQYE
jgi:phosphate transport system permease protein